VIESAETAVTLPWIAMAPPAPGPPNVRPPGAPLAFGPKTPAKPPFAPKRPLVVVVGAVARPAANATPPTATTSAKPSRTLTSVEAPDGRWGGGVTTGAGGGAECANGLWPAGAVANGEDPAGAEPGWTGVAEPSGW